MGRVFYILLFIQRQKQPLPPGNINSVLQKWTCLFWKLFKCSFFLITAICFSPKGRVCKGVFWVKIKNSKTIPSVSPRTIRCLNYTFSRIPIHICNNKHIHICVRHNSI